jgi:hypothetical protein
MIPDSYLARWAATLALARYISRRAQKRKATICRRRSDGTLWAASSPQNIGIAMRGLFTKAPLWHFAKVRIWRGLPIVSRKVFWSFSEYGKFDIAQTQDAFWLPAWPEGIETAKLEAKP